MSASMIELQRSLTDYIRDPEHCPGPEGIEARRLQIYRDLFFNNIVSFLANGFPVLRSLYSDDQWQSLIRDFFRRHRCHSPLFIDIAQEFMAYLAEEREGAAEQDPPFMQELAHYEWLELALDVAEDTLPPPVDIHPELLDCRLRLSPLAWPQVYAYPVQQIRADFQPAEPPEQPSCIVVYRNRADKVGFLEINPATARLLELMAEPPPRCAGELVALLADEMGADAASLQGFARELFAQLLALEIVFIDSPG